MRKIKYMCVVILSVLLASCAGGPPNKARAAADTTPSGTTEEITAMPEKEATKEFIVTEEIYTNTFGEIEAFIATLSEIIRGRNYETWLTYLSDEYIEQTSDPAYLREQSEKPTLKKEHIVLEDLKDFFYYVVVPSRTQAELDDIEFIGEDKIKAISIIRNTRGVLYLLVRRSGEWKIGVL